MRCEPGRSRVAELVGVNSEAKCAEIRALYQRTAEPFLFRQDPWIRSIHERCLCRHTNQPRQPIFRHTITTQHIPRMNKNCGIDFFSSAPNWLERCVVEVQRIYASELRICIHVRPNLCAAQPELPDAAFEFGRRKIGILHWNSSEAGETLRMIANDFGNVIV